MLRLSSVVAVLLLGLSSVVLVSSPILAAEANTSATQQPSGASEKDEKTTVTKVSGAEKWTLALKDLSAHVGPIRLTNSTSSDFIPLNISSRATVTNAELILNFSNSISLKPKRSQLRVLLNDVTIAQVPLQPDKPKVEGLKIVLPIAQLRTGYNKLGFTVAQHYTYQCEDPSAPELWTEIDTLQSTISMNADLQTVNPTLADLDELVGPALGNPSYFRILMPENSREELLNAAAVTAQAIGLRMKYRPARFLHGTAMTAALKSTTSQSSVLGGLSQENLTGADSILVGTKDDLKAFLSEQILGEITGAYLGVYPLASDARYIVMIVSGVNQEQVKQAATSLSFMNFPFTDTSSTLIKNLQVPQRATLGRKINVATGEKYFFNQLSNNQEKRFTTTTFAGSGYHKTDIEFYLPPDFYVPEGENTKISLNYAYDAKMRKDSVLNIYLNNSFERAIALKNSDGDKVQGYDVFIPLRSFLPGRNVIRIEPVLVTLVHGECEMVQDRNLRFTLFENSTIEFPKAYRYVEQPNLKLFAETSFPYFNSAQDAPLSVVLLSHTPDAMAATWTLMSKMAQISDTPFYKAKVSLTVPKEPRHLIVLSSLDKVDPKLLDNSPIYSQGVPNYPYPVSTLPLENDKKSKSGMMDNLMDAKAADNNNQSAANNVATTVRIGQNNLPQKAGMITAFESPYAAKHTVTMFTAANPELLRQRMEALVSPEIWSQLADNLSVWTTVDKEVRSQRAGSSFYLGNPQLKTVAGYHLSKNPLWWVLSVFLITILLAWLTYMLLRRRFNRRHAAGARIDD